MLQSIWDDVRREFSYGNMVTRIILVNIAVFIFVQTVNLALYISNGGVPSPAFTEFIRFLSMPADGWYFLTHPWTIITSMFLHVGFFHILWNMLFLYWFGRIVGDFIGNQRILPIYILGGIAGAILFFVTANLLPYGQAAEHVYAYGASAGVMAITVAAGAIAPDFIMRLLFIGDVKLKYIVAVLVLLDLFALANDANTGGHFAHLGGAVFGFLFIRALQDGSDMSAPVNRIFDGVSDFFRNLVSGNGGNSSSRRRGPKVAYKSPKANRSRNSSKGSAASDNEPRSDDQDRIDAILDKISQSGYDSLTEEEKEFLFNASKK